MKFEFHIYVHDAAETRKLDDLISLVKEIKNTMVTEADLGAGIADLKTVAKDAGAKITKALDDLVAKLNQQNNTVDLTDELADIRSLASDLSSIGQKAEGVDPGVTPPPVPPTP